MSHAFALPPAKDGNLRLLAIRMMHVYGLLLLRLLLVNLLCCGVIPLLFLLQLSGGVRDRKPSTKVVLNTNVSSGTYGQPLCTRGYTCFYVASAFIYRIPVMAIASICGASGGRHPVATKPSSIEYVLNALRKAQSVQI